MTTTVNYKFIRNTTGVPLTLNNYVYGSDGSDKQRKIIIRKLSTEDIGTAAGQTGHALGAMVEALPKNYNVLFFIGYVIRKVNALGNVNAFNFIDNQYSVIEGSSFEAEYMVGEDNTLRVRSINSNLPFIAGDLVVFDVIIGERDDPNDKINT